MLYRLNEVKTGLFSETTLEEAAEKRLRKVLGKGALGVSLKDLSIVSKSLDARDKQDLKMVYTVDFSSDKRLDLPKGGRPLYRQLKAGVLPDNPPVVAGSGPCGLFCALVLAAAGLSPIVLERGRMVEERIKDVDRYWKEGALNPESNVQFGEGGAGTFSDGKLTTGIRDPRVEKVFDEFILAGADPEIKIRKRPHIGTDRLREILPKMRERIISLGGSFRFETALTGISMQDGKLKGVTLSNGEFLPASILVLAIGHSARDTYRMLVEEGLCAEAKAFSIGARIEHPQEMLDEAMYGERYKEVREIAGPAEYKLAHHGEDGRGVYTFCMCPGGEIVMSASCPGEIVTNGMSGSQRDGRFGNSALLVDVRKEDYLTGVFPTMRFEPDGEENPADFEKMPVLLGAAFQKHYEMLAYRLGNGRAPETTLARFSDSTLYQSLPSFAGEDILKAMPFFERKVKGFSNGEARLVGVETRSSAPIRFLRGENLQGSIEGIYPAGEGAGYAGGITSAAVDGIRVAEAVVEAINGEK